MTEITTKNHVSAKISTNVIWLRAIPLSRKYPKMVDNYELVKNAIENKQQVVATYKGLRREMCPHVIGWKGDKQQCLFYQFGGSSSSGTIVPGSEKNWRCLSIDQLEDLEVQNGNWYTSDNHSRNQTCVDRIDLEISY